MCAQIYNISKIDIPPLAYLSVSETPIKQNSKAYTYGFEFALIEWSHLHTVTCKYSYSTMIFKDSHRLKENVVGYGNVFIFDIDSKPDKPSYKSEEVIEAVRGLKSLVVTTRSHTEENHRLRLILLADKCMNRGVDSELYHKVMQTIISFCGLDEDMLDRSCFSIDRQYAPNPINQKHYYIDGDVLPMEFIMELAQESLQHEKCIKRTPSPIAAVTVRSFALKTKRSFIKERLTFEFMKEVLEERGLTVLQNGKVVIPGNPTDAICVDRKTGLLRDFANDTSYDPVSVLYDHYNVPLKDATNYIYEKLGGR